MPIFLITKLITVYGSDEDKDSTTSLPIGYLNGSAEEARIYCESKTDEIEDKKSVYQSWCLERHKFYMEHKEKIKVLKREVDTIKEKSDKILSKITEIAYNDESVKEFDPDLMRDLGKTKKEYEEIYRKFLELEAVKPSTVFLKDNPEPENVQDVIRYDYLELQEIK
jgi:uncharacterized phage infection (PIP) family protein YhgE